MEKLWRYTIETQLEIDPSEVPERPIFFTESPSSLLPTSKSNSKVSRAKMAEIMFESFHSPMVQVANQALLTLYASAGTASGSGTELVIESGHGATNIVPIIGGSIVPESIVNHEVTGSDITDHLVSVLNKAGHSISPWMDQAVAQDMKESLCRVAYMMDIELGQSHLGRIYHLPDGKSITVSSERSVIRVYVECFDIGYLETDKPCCIFSFLIYLLNANRLQAPEIMFNPSLIGLGASGIHEKMFVLYFRHVVNSERL